EAASGGLKYDSVRDGAEDIRAAELCAEAMRSAAAIARGVAAPPRKNGSPQVIPLPPGDVMAGPRAISTGEAMPELERCATQLGEALRIHRSATLGAVANGTLTADAALLRVETVRSLEAMSRHAWRAAAHLVGRS